VTQLDHTQTFPGNIIITKQSQLATKSSTVDSLQKNRNNRKLFLFNFEMRFFWEKVCDAITMRCDCHPWK